ncbi:MAG TPA: MDR family MFS transporter [Candidatus Limnocylindrales bacterium]|nr:MDR family MFS transporter [Candidatus Limnocylindrales bacterium]
MSSHAPDIPADDAPILDRAPIELPHRVRLEILGAVLLGILLSALDQTIVGTALPRIVTDLRGNDVYTWAFTSYLLTATVSGPIYGKLSDLYGRRSIFVLGTSIFLIGSVLCGLSQEMWQFIVFRGLQGLGAGALFPVALSIIADIFAPSERGKYQGLFGAVFGLSSIVGPAIGGIITDTVGWHWIFYVNLPLGAIALFIIWRTLPTRRSAHPEASLDYLGAALLIAALVPILIGFTNKQTSAWTDPQVGGLIALGLAFAAVLIVVESRAAEPIIPLRLFRMRTFTASVVAIFLAAMGFFAAVVFLPRWFQVVNGSSATESGYQILPLLFGLIVSAVASGQIVARTGRAKPLIIGALVVVAFGLWLLTNLRPDTPLPIVWLWMLITGLGIGPTFAVFTLVVQNSVPVRQLGAATSSLGLFQQVGGTVGLAITGTIFAETLLGEVPRQLVANGVPPQFANAFSSGGGSEALNQLSGVGDLGAAILAQVPEAFRSTVEPLIPGIVAAIHTAFSIATASTFVIGIVTAIAAAVVVAVVMPSGASQPGGAEAGAERVPERVPVAEA